MYNSSIPYKGFKMEFIEAVESKIIKGRKVDFASYKCQCGKICIKRKDNVKYGITKSCGTCSEPRLKALLNIINGVVVVDDLGMNNQVPKKREARFRCQCGKLFTATVNSVKTGQKRSCGCLVKAPSTYTHLLSKHPLYRKWSGMITRTTNKNEKCYKRYGGRDIAVCDEWRNNFMSFYNWAMANGYEKGLTIDRIDNNGNYEPSNCQWITMEANSIKDRHSTFIKLYKVEEICSTYISGGITVTELARQYGTYKNVISQILKDAGIKIKNRRMRKDV